MDARQIDILNQRVYSHEVKRVAHARTYDRFSWWGRGLGLLAVVLTTIVGTSVFTSLNNNPSLGAKITVAIVSVLAAVTAATKEFMGYDKRAIEHRQACADFGRLRNAAQEILARDAPDAETDAAITKNGDEAEALDDREPALPTGRYAWAEEWVDRNRQPIAQAAGRPEPLTPPGMAPA